MLTKIIGLYLIFDGIVSWLIYKRQKILILGKKIVSLYPFSKHHKIRNKGIVKTVKQDLNEHLPRFFRVILGFTLVVTPLPI
ncbi:MAG: hypothetical protein QW156_00955 [Candidatus Aenigmatarchaeota archaeon]